MNRTNLQTLREGFARLARGQKLLVGGVILLIVLTWMAVCAILASYLI
ncbi:MAG: hypothetical protein PVJ34_04060 [Anaerolineae bacterium]|jgi:hypothetical protein